MPTGPLTDSFSSEAERTVLELLREENIERLERFRFTGSANRVYHIPIGDDGRFVVLKLLPSRVADTYRGTKGRLRNLLYGEKDVHVGRDRVQMEIQRYREWQEAGLPVPRLIECSIPGARLIEGLPYPTFYSILCELPVPTERRLEVHAVVTRGLAHQHAVARWTGNKGLVHRDPGPWNVLYDLETDNLYWFDLEHPADYPYMSVEDLAVRALRIYLFGILDHLSPWFDDVIDLLVNNYTPRYTLLLLAASLERGARTLPMRVANRFGLRKARRAQQLRIARALRERLQMTMAA